MGLVHKFAKTFLRCLDDRIYSQLQFLWYQKYWTDFKQPQTFNEKIQWLKLNVRDKRIPECVDKILARDYVSDVVGSQVLVPLLGVFRHADAVDFSQLPNQFALKSSHASGWNIISMDKSRLDLVQAKKQIKKWLSASFYPIAREWAYSQISPGLICEELLLGPDGMPPEDFKFFCFGGQPRYVQVDFSRFVDHSRSLYDTDWNLLDCALEYPRNGSPVPRPRCLSQMIEIAKRLSQPFPFVRVDLYQVGGKVFFGEMTFYPGKGVERFRPQQWDLEFGKLLNLE